MRLRTIPIDVNATSHRSAQLPASCWVKVGVTKHGSSFSAAATALLTATS